ncbi:MAG: translation elongation factor Ts [Mycoplasmoidaceae bacterium]|nr:translation elongation factor Ts [Mycoplasmoidaceae bacterium]
MADAKLIKQLRDMTQAGFVDCKNALVQNNDNLELAVKYLREKGLAKAAKKAGAIAAEGVVLVGKNANSAYLIEINTQTDFAAKNENFTKLCDSIMKVVADSQCDNAEVVKGLKLADGETVQSACDGLTGKIGEKINVRRFNRLVATGEQDVGIYQHANKKYGAICLFDKKVDDLLKKQICMHIVARNPKFVDASQVDSKWVAAEKAIIEKTSQTGNKPAHFLQKIVEGRMQKRLAEVCLFNQEFDFEPTITVGKFLASKGIKVLSFVRYEVGEGIEKKESNFAAEVAEQTGK